jgi:hypothetical protein
MGLCGSRDYTLVCCDWDAPQHWPGRALALAETLLANPAVVTVHYCPTAVTVVAQNQNLRDSVQDCVDQNWVATAVADALSIPVTSHVVSASQKGVRDLLAARAHECWRGAVARLAQQHCDCTHLTTAGQLAALAVYGLTPDDIPYWQRWGVTLKRSAAAPVSATYLHITAATDPAELVSP